MSDPKIQHLLESICWDARVRGRPLEGLEEEKSKLILQRINADPLAAGAEYSTGLHSTSRSLLSWACHLGLSLELVQGVVRLVPEVSGATRTLPILEEAVFSGEARGKNFSVVAFLVRRYPEGFRKYLGLARKIFSLFPPDQSLPLLKEYLTVAKLKDSTRGWNWEVGEPFPRERLQAVAEIHQQHSLVIRTAVRYSCFCDVVERDSSRASEGGGIVVSFAADASFPYVFSELLSVPNLTPRAIEVEEPEDLEYAIAALAPRPMETGNVIFPQPHRPLPASKLSAVKEVYLVARTRHFPQVDRLLRAIYQFLPGVRALTLNGDAMNDSSSSDEELDTNATETEESALMNLLPLSDRLQELTEQFFPICSISILLDLMEASSILRKLNILQNAWTEEQKCRFFSLLAANTSLLHLGLESPRKPSDGSHLVQALARNSTLQKLVLYRVFDDKASQIALADLVRHKHNTTLQSFKACCAESFSLAMNYWCQLNQLEPQLHAENADLETVIQLLEPSLLSSNHQMVFALLRSRVELWCRTT